MRESTIDIAPYLEDSSGYRGTADRVVVPETVEELQTFVATCARGGEPVTIAGAGTGLTGARVPHGGSIISLERFRNLQVSQGKVRCGAGVALADLQAEAAKTKQFLGPNP
ncbi:MAG: FAD-binding oxidoreductase, partial [Acidobacteriaceae bacterium]|nr:FAD-binding oxidoreductase [Acidobacteriaceae bacterium]